MLCACLAFFVVKKIVLHITT